MDITAATVRASSLSMITTDSKQSTMEQSLVQVLLLTINYPHLGHSLHIIQECCETFDSTASTYFRVSSVGINQVRSK